jgi:hypothetical protein
MSVALSSSDGREAHTDCDFRHLVQSSRKTEILLVRSCVGMLRCVVAGDDGASAAGRFSQLRDVCVGHVAGSRQA